MPTPEIHDQVNERLSDLCARHLPFDDQRLDRFYESGRGDYPRPRPRSRRVR